MARLREEGGGFEVRLDNRRIFLLVFAVLVLLVVSFAVGYVVGRGAAVPPPPPEKLPPTPRPAAQPTATAPFATAVLQTPTPTPRPLLSATSTAGTPRAREGFAVQVVALEDRGQVAAVLRKLGEKGLSAYLVEPQPGEGKKLVRVRVGPYEARAEAERVLAALKKEYPKGFVTREE